MQTISKCKMGVFIIILALSALSFGQGEECTEVVKMENPSPNRKPAIHAERGTGELYMSTGAELQVSRDQGATWQEVAKSERGGRHYNSNAFDADWRAGRLAVFSIGNPVAWMTLDNGKSWQEIARPKHDGWTYGAVDWSDDQPTRMLGKEHHTANLWFSPDAGENWEKMEAIVGYFGFGFSPEGAILVGAVEGKKSVIPGEGKAGIYRSEDDGKTWTLVYEGALHTKVKPRCLEDKVYWPSPEGLLVSSDDGKTWSVMSASPKAVEWGPYFGKSAEEMVVVSEEGIHKTQDGGKTWSLAVAKSAMPASMQKYGGKVAYDFAWDCRKDIYYGTTSKEGGVMKLEKSSK